MTGFYEGGQGALPVPHGLDGHTDVTISSPSEDQVLKYDSATNKWTNQAEDAPAIAIADLTDVNAPSPADATVLTWVDAAGEWQAAVQTPGAGININDVLDVTVTTPSNGQVLEYTAGIWVNKTPTYAEKSYVDANFPKIHAEARISIDTNYAPSFLWSNGFSATITQEDDARGGGESPPGPFPFIRTTLSETLPAQYRISCQAFNTGIGFGVTSDFARAFLIDYAAGGTGLDFKVLKDGSSYNNVLLASEINANEQIIVDIVITEVV